MKRLMVCAAILLENLEMTIQKVMAADDVNYPPL